MRERNNRSRYLEEMQYEIKKGEFSRQTMIKTHIMRTRMQGSSDDEDSETPRSKGK